jgi:hypothetical protein
MYNTVTTRSQEYGKEIERLQAEKRRREHISDEWNNFLQNQVKKEEEERKRIEKEKKELEKRHEQDHEHFIYKYSQTLAQNERIFMQKEQDLLDKLKLKSQQLADLEQFKADRDDIRELLEETRRRIKVTEIKHSTELKQLEHQFMEKQADLQAQTAQRIAKSRQTYKLEVDRELRLETMQIREQNRKYEEDLGQITESSKVLTTHNKQMLQTITELRRDASLSAERDHEFAKRGYKQGRMIKDLTNQLQYMKHSLERAIRDFKKEREELEYKYEQQIEAQSKKLVEYRRTNVLQNKSLRHVKALAKRILEGRSEVETFLLDCIDSVKEEAQQRRQLEFKQAKRAYHQRVRTLAMPKRGSGDGRFPALMMNSSGGDVPPPPMLEQKSNVKASGMALQDRQRILELMFAKVHNILPSKPAELNPPHSFDVQLRRSSDSQNRSKPGSRNGTGGGSNTLRRQPQRVIEQALTPLLYEGDDSNTFLTSVTSNAMQQQENEARDGANAATALVQRDDNEQQEQQELQYEEDDHYDTVDADAGAHPTTTTTIDEQQQHLQQQNDSGSIASGNDFAMAMQHPQHLQQQQHHHHHQRSQTPVELL